MVDAGYCYRCRDVVWSVSALVTTVIDPVKTDDPFEVPFVDIFVRAHGNGVSHWRHVANTIIRPVRGGDGVFRQITLTTDAASVRHFYARSSVDWVVYTGVGLS